MLELECSRKQPLPPNVPSATYRLNITPREVARLVISLDLYIVQYGDLIADSELARYEDLKYRLLGLPDSLMRLYVEGRQHDNAQP